ncbi:PTS glucitol/sorbitol transporter subunit IIA [Zobellella sp. An-6]|uniref:PTS glucitol/sorbitol transporter subunit IIA n=1 Tax=Zobellella sp. An-6 TaxID=3400218 RepID=UPI004042789D
MKILYSTKVTKVGDSAAEALEENMMILFNDNAPADVADYCFIHPDAELTGDITVQCEVLLGQKSYPVTAVGNLANQNLGQLGHITIRFDGAAEPEYPGTVHVRGECPVELGVGAEITFKLKK